MTKRSSSFSSDISFEVKKCKYEIKLLILSWIIIIIGACLVAIPLSSVNPSDRNNLDNYPKDKKNMIIIGSVILAFSILLTLYIYYKLSCIECYLIMAGLFLMN